MHFSLAGSVVAALATTCAALNVIVNNDDGFAAANVREFYRLLKEKGHDVWLIAPVDNQSGQGGRSVFTTSPTLTSPSQYDIVPAGSPSFGTDPNDSHIWYYNGTPAAVTFFALDYVVPKFTGWSIVDLLVAGPNFGTNLGPFLFTLSGTIGATYVHQSFGVLSNLFTFRYAAVERGIPAIAFNAGNPLQRSYRDIEVTTQSGAPDPATIDAQLSVDLVQQLVKGADRRDRLLPYGHGLNVNIPTITSFDNTSCIKPPFIHTRLSGGAQITQAVFNDATKLFNFGATDSAGLNTCINGDCRLPGETTVLTSGCYSTVSVFTVDYDAPSPNGERVRSLLEPLVTYQRPGYGNRLGRLRPDVFAKEQEARPPRRVE